MSTYWMLKCVPCDVVSDSDINRNYEPLVWLIDNLDAIIKVISAPGDFQVTLSYAHDDFVSFACAHVDHGELVVYNEYGYTVAGWEEHNKQMDTERAAWRVAH